MADRHVLIDDLQLITPQEFENIQKYPAEALMRVVHDAVGDGRYYSGFTAVEDGAWGLDIAPGRLYLAGEIFRRDDTVSFDFFQPSIRPSSQKKWVAIVGWAQPIPEDDIQERQFLVSAQTDDTHSKPTPMLKWNKAEIGHVLGSEAATPVKPSAAAGQVLIAYVLLSTGGIEQVVMVEENLVPQSARNQLENLANRLWREKLGATIDSLQTDLAALNARVDGSLTKAAFDFFLNDYRETRENANKALDLALQLDAAAPSALLYDLETFANEALSDTGATGYSARIDNGLRFPFAASDDGQSLDLVNPYDGQLKIVNDFALPDYNDFVRLSTWQAAMSQSEALNAYSNVTVTMKTGKNPIYRTQAGASFVMTYQSPSQTGANEADGHVYRNGVLYKLQDVGPVGGPYVPDQTDYYTFQATYESTSSSVLAGYDYYSYEHTETTDFTGQGRAQTWLQSQDGWCIGVDLYLASVGTPNDVRVSIFEAPGDTPDLQRLVADVTVPFADLTVAGSTADDGLYVALPPHIHKAGKRYGISILSQGSHRIYVLPQNGAAIGGAMYRLTATGAWEKEPTDITMACRVRYAQFKSNRVTVDMQPLQLTGGFTGAEIWAECIIPATCRLDYEVQIGGQYYVLGADIGARLAADLAGAGAYLPLRTVFVGSRDLMPGVGVKASRSGVSTSRAATVLHHVSTARPTGGAAATARVLVRVANWNAAKHTFDIDVMDGATVVNADTIEETDLGGKIRQFVATFDLSASPLATIPIVLHGTTSDPEDQFVAIERRLLPYA